MANLDKFIKSFSHCIGFVFGVIACLEVVGCILIEKVTGIPHDVVLTWFWIVFLATGFVFLLIILGIIFRILFVQWVKKEEF